MKESHLPVLSPRSLLSPLQASHSLPWDTESLFRFVFVPDSWSPTEASSPSLCALLPQSRGLKCWIQGFAGRRHLVPLCTRGLVLSYLMYSHTPLRRTLKPLPWALCGWFPWLYSWWTKEASIELIYNMCLSSVHPADIVSRIRFLCQRIKWNILVTVCTNWLTEWCKNETKSHNQEAHHCYFHDSIICGSGWGILLFKNYLVLKGIYFI